MDSGLNGLRRYALALIYGNVAVFSILLTTVLFALVESHDTFAVRGRETAENLVHTLSLSVGAEVKQVDNALLSVVLQVNRFDNGRTLDMGALTRVIGEQGMLVPQVDNIRLTDAQGGVLNPGGQAGMSVADRDYFQIARSSPPQLVVSEPLQGRISKHWGIVLARARTDASGHFLGIAYANLFSAHLVDEFDDVALGPQGAVSLRSGSLRLIARYSPGSTDHNVGLGSSKVSPELQQALTANGDHGAFTSRTAVDGIERINAYQRIPGSRMLLLVGLGTSDFYAPWKREAAEMAALSLMLEIAVVWSSLWIYRQQARQLRSHAEIVRLAAQSNAMLDNELVGMVKLKNRLEVWHNKALAALFGYDRGELTGRSSRLLYPSDEAFEEIGRAYADLAEYGQYRTQVQMVRKDGRLIWIDLSSAKLPDGESLWFLLDISRVKSSEEAALHLSRHDALTGLANRTKLVDELGRKILGARQRGQRLAVCYIDLDGFKGVNDRHGHQAGDRLLKVAARRMGSAVREGDLVARIGGDEFVAVLCDLSDDSEIPVVLQRLIESLTAPIAVRDGAQTVIGASIGVAIFPEHAEQAERLLNLADEEMYAAKRAGKNRFVIHST